MSRKRFVLLLIALLGFTVCVLSTAHTAATFSNPLRPAAVSFFEAHPTVAKVVRSVPPLRLLPQTGQELISDLPFLLGFVAFVSAGVLLIRKRRR